MGKSSKMAAEEYNTFFAKRLRALMDGEYGQEKISQIELAEAIGTTRQAISQYRNGTVAPNTEKLCQLADHFKVSTDFLLGRTTVKSGDSSNMAIEKRLGLTDSSIGAIERLRFMLAGVSNSLNPLFENGFEIVISDLCDLAFQYRIAKIQEKEICSENADQECINSHREGKIAPAQDASGKAIPGLFSAYMNTDSFLDFRLHQISSSLNEMIKKMVVLEGEG